MTTGTGSGKSFCFAIPVVSEALRLRDQGVGGVKAILVYPLNALANSQYADLAARSGRHRPARLQLHLGPRRGRRGRGPASAFREATGREGPHDSEVISRRSPPGAGRRHPRHQLRHARARPHPLPRPEPSSPSARCRACGSSCSTRVHTHTGRQGADVACLIRRLKEHTRTAGKLRCVATSATVDSSSPERAAEQIAGLRLPPLRRALRARGRGRGGLHSATSRPPRPTPCPRTPAADPEAPRPLRAGATRRPSPRPATPSPGGRAAAPEDLRRQAAGLLPRARPSYPEGPGARPRRGPLGRARRALPARSSGPQALPGTRRSGSSRPALVVAARTPVRTDEGEELLAPAAQGAYVFFSQGRTVTACLRLHLSDLGQTTCPDCPEGDAPTFPLSRSAPPAARSSSSCLGGRGGRPSPGRYPRHFEALEGWEASAPEGLAVGRVPTGEAPRPPVRLPRLPLPRALGSRGQPPRPLLCSGEDGSPRKGYEGAVPANVAVCPSCGALGGGLRTRAPTPRWPSSAGPSSSVPTCGIVYDRRSVEFNKFFLAGVVGKATATDALVEPPPRGAPPPSPSPR
ncbi:MAG: hypothetical protein KatS3mg014_2611 [Actinomycetota bacterium]|nr:MAG: hypothetical protein KatS3mg014_2611 [Actinomycetota bacterium]